MKAELDKRDLELADVRDKLKKREDELRELKLSVNN